MPTHFPIKQEVAINQSKPESDATLNNLIAQMSRGASVLNGWDAVLNIDEDVVNQIFQARFKQSAQADWKNITIAFCQAFPNPSGGGQLAVYTNVCLTLATPSLTFLGNNQAFVDVSFKATGRTGTASKLMPAGFDPGKDADAGDPGLDWTYTPFNNLDFSGKVPLSAITGSPRIRGEATEFVIDFPSGSFTSPVFAQVKDPDALRLQLRNYLQTHDVQYVINTIRTDLLDQVPQMAPKAFRIAVLTTNERRNVFQIFIATRNPIQRDLSVGVNEPIPDGYSLSVMFNKSTVSQLKASLMVQAWLFMESNLIFPGRTSLSLGPQFTPDDALILGSLEVDTSSPLKPVEPRNPQKEQPMLNIEKTRQITPSNQPAFTAYGDDMDANAWYIPPKVIWAKSGTSQLPQFSLVKYNSTGGAITGFCRFSVQLMIDPTQDEALKKAVPGALTPQFDWIQSGAVFTYTIDGKSTSVHSQPSNFGSQTVTFSVPLADQKAIAAFVNAFSPSGSGGGTFGVSYDLAANTRLPAVTVVSTFNSAIAYQYQINNKYRIETQYHTDTWGHRTSSQVPVFVGTYVREMLQQSQAGTVKVTPGQGLTPTLLTMVQDWANIQLRKDVEQSVSTALELIKNPTSDFSMNSVASFSHTLETSNVVPWYFTVDGTLPAFDAATWGQVYSEVNQQQLEVTFEIQADLAKLGIEHVNLTFQYGNPPPKTHTFDPAAESAWFLSLPGQFDESKSFIAGYQYKYDVIYAASENGGDAPPTLSTGWISGDSTSVKLSVAQLGLMAITFEASNIAWESVETDNPAASGIKQITVDWNWIPGGGGPVLVDSLVLTNAENSVKRTLRSAGPTNNQQYQYSLTFLMSDGTKLHANGLTGTSPLQRISHPLSDVSVSVFPMFPDDAKAVILRATFDDEINDIHLSHQWRALPKSTGGGSPTLNTDSFGTWEFKAVVANLNTATVVFSGTWVDKDNKQTAIPKTLLVGNNNTLVISNTQKTVTAVVDASNVAFADAMADGVYRVVALVANTVSGGPAGTDSNPLANAMTITFGHDQPAIQYYPAENIDIDATPTFHYQYTYTENINQAKQTKVTNAWAQPQSTVSTALPVVPGAPPVSPQTSAAVPPGAVKAVMPTFIDGANLDPRTRALFARHDGFCWNCDQRA